MGLLPLKYNYFDIVFSLFSIHETIFQLLIEWGCDVHAKGPRGMTAFENIKNDDFRDFLIRE